VSVWKKDEDYVRLSAGVRTNICCVLQESRMSVWKKDEDYVRMDGSTGAQSRKRFTANFNDAKNERLTLLVFFLLPPDFNAICRPD